MALAERFLAERYNKPGHEVVSHFTFVLASDGDLMEGVAQEACSLAGHQRLAKLIVLYDSNRITIDGSTELSFSDDTAAKFAAMGWHVQTVDGLDMGAVDTALANAKLSELPSLIVCHTTIGYGSPNKAGSETSHGAALGVEEVRLTKEALGIPQEDFWVPKEALDYCRKSVAEGRQVQADWLARLGAFVEAYPDLGAELRALARGEFSESWKGALPAFDAPIATRNASNKVLNAIAPHLPTLISGCADLAGSVKTTIKEGGDMLAQSPTGRNVNYGVREHAMAAAVNGMVLHGGVRAFGGTFLIFSDYCRPSLRLAALMRCPSLMLFSHDSIGLGEDGPTHQPIEQAMSLRLVPNFNLMRPADGNETSVCWRVAVESRETPCAILLTRQDVPSVAPPPSEDHPALKGAYILREASGPPHVLLVATGSEVALALEARTVLEGDGVPTRVVSMPSWFLFEAQPESYRESVLPKSLATVSVEAGATLGWERYAQAHVGLDHFGASAPAERLFEEFGFTVENVVSKAKSLIA
jgi:transketolase